MPLVNKSPIAEQVYSVLLERLNTSTYQPGERMPSESDFAKELDVSRSSVRTALVRLETAGHIIRRHGEGTFVRKRPPASNVALGIEWDFTSLVRETGRDPRIVVYQKGIREGSIIECEKLELTQGEKVFELIRLFYAADEPVIYTSNVIPLSYLKVNAEEVDGTLVIMEILDRYFGLEIGYIDTQICVGESSPVIGKLLNLPTGESLLRLDEVFFNNAEEEPILYSDSYLNTMSIRLHRIRQWEGRDR